jgi:hypothetical protein
MIEELLQSLVKMEGEIQRKCILIVRGEKMGYKKRIITKIKIDIVKQKFK